LICVVASSTRERRKQGRRGLAFYEEGLEGGKEGGREGGTMSDENEKDRAVAGIGKRRNEGGREGGREGRKNRKRIPSSPATPPI